MKQLLYSKPIFGKEEIEAVNRVLLTDWLSGGEETIKFEEELAEWWGVKYAIAVNSGSSANFVALQALELPKFSTIITFAGGVFPTMISPIIYLNHSPDFVDIDLDTLCLDLDEVEAIAWQADAIFFAHTLGYMPDMKRLMKIAKVNNLKVIEDCCDAMGSKQNGKKAGTFGDLATVSFYPAHHMTTGGEGGAVLTNNKELYWRCRSIRDWGRDCKCRWGHPQPACGNRWKNKPFDHRYYYTRLGLNFKMTEMQAAFGREQLKRIDGFIEKRKRNYKILADALGKPFNPDISPFAFPVFAKNKEKIMMELEKKGIQTRTLFAGNILKHPAYKNLEDRPIGVLKNSDKILKEAFFVGVGPHLSVEDMEYIGDCLKAIL